MSKQALLNINLLAARKGAAELEFAVKKVEKSRQNKVSFAIHKCKHSFTNFFDIF